MSRSAIVAALVFVVGVATCGVVVLDTVDDVLGASADRIASVGGDNLTDVDLAPNTSDVDTNEVTEQAALGKLAPGDPVGDPPEDPICRYYDDLDGAFQPGNPYFVDYQYRHRAYVARALSADYDGWYNQSFYDFAQYEQSCGHPPSDQLAALTGSDWYWRRPPSTFSLMRAFLDRYDEAAQSSQTKSVYPSGDNATVDVEAGPHWIRDAHIAIYAVLPSTQFHKNATSTIHWIETEGEFQVVSDARVDVPVDDTEGPVREYYDLTRFHRTDVCLLKGAYDDRTNGSNPCVEADDPLERYQYGVDDPVDQWQSEAALTYDLDEDVAAVSAVAVFEMQGTYRKEECSDWNDTAEICEGNWTVREDTTVSSTVAVAENRTVDVRTGKPEVDVKLARFPDGHAEAVITTEDYIGGYRFPSVDTEVTWNWRFYTRRDTAWDRVTVVADNGTSTDRKTTDSKALSLQWHAFPSKTGTRLTPFEVRELDREPLTTRSGPNGTLHPRVHVPVAEESYTQPRRLKVYLPQAPYSDTGKIVGMLPRDDGGVTYSHDIEHVEKVYDTALEVDVLEENTETVRLHVTLYGAKGGRVNTTGRPNDYVLINGKRYQTGENGQIIATVDRKLYVTVRYHASEWTEEPTSYLSAQQTLTFRPNSSTVGDLGYMLLHLLGFSLPFLLFLYLADKLSDRSTWPPWRIRRN